MKKTIYLCLCFTFCLTNFLNAQIVYTQVNETLYPDDIYQFDIDNNGSIDYELNINETSTSGCYFISFKCLNNNYVGCYSAPVKSLAPYSYENNTMIDESLSWYSTDFMQTLALGNMCTGYFFGNFRGVEDEFIGLKFSNGTDTYYGWIRVDVSTNADWITIKDYAFDISGFGFMTSVSQNTSYQVLAEYQLYPNPTKGELIIESEKKINKVSIYSLTGALVKEQKVNSNKIKLELSDLDKGVYIVESLCGDETLLRRIVIE
jgi:hypothetical protein